MVYGHPSCLSYSIGLAISVVLYKTLGLSQWGHPLMEKGRRQNPSPMEWGSLLPFQILYVASGTFLMSSFTSILGNVFLCLVRLKEKWRLALDKVRKFANLQNLQKSNTLDKCKFTTFFNFRQKIHPTEWWAGSLLLEMVSSWLGLFCFSRIAGSARFFIVWLWWRRESPTFGGDIGHKFRSFR